MRYNIFDNNLINRQIYLNDFCEVASISLYEMLSRCRKTDIANKRRMLIKLLYDNFPSEYNSELYIGILLRRDRVTVMYNLKVHKDLVDTDTKYRAEFTELQQLMANYYSKSENNVPQY